MSDYESDAWANTKAEMLSDIKYHLEQYAYKKYNMRVVSLNGKRTYMSRDGSKYFDYTGRVEYTENGVRYTMPTHGSAFYYPSGKEGHFRGYFGKATKKKYKRDQTNTAGIPYDVLRF